jgi:hypothetical protein
VNKEQALLILNKFPDEGNAKKVKDWLLDISTPSKSSEEDNNDEEEPVKNKAQVPVPDANAKVNNSVLQELN